MWEVHFPLVLFRWEHTFSAQMQRKGFLFGFVWHFSLSASGFLYLLLGTLWDYETKNSLVWRIWVVDRGSCSPFVKWTFQYRYKTHRESHKVSVSIKLRRSKFAIHFKFCLFGCQQYFSCKFCSSQLYIMHIALPICEFSNEFSITPTLKYIYTYGRLQDSQPEGQWSIY